MAQSREEAVADVTSGPIPLDEELTWRARLASGLGFVGRWCSRVGRSLSGFDDDPIERKPGQDLGAPLGGGERLGAAGERFVARDGGGVLLSEFGEDLESELGAAAIQFHIAGSSMQSRPTRP